MKPIVIDADSMTFTEIKDAIEEAYQAGLEDGYDKGYKDGKKSMQLTWRGDPIPTNIPASNPFVEFDPWWWMVKPTVTTTPDITLSSQDDNRAHSNSV